VIFGLWLGLGLSIQAGQVLKACVSLLVRYRRTDFKVRFSFGLSSMA